MTTELLRIVEDPRYRYSLFLSLMSFIHGMEWILMGHIAAWDIFLNMTQKETILIVARQYTDMEQPG